MSNQNPGAQALHRQSDRRLEKGLEELVVTRKDAWKIPENFKEFNKVIGLPLHPATLIPSELTDYQLEYEKRWTKYHKLIVNKARKIGATDLALRVIAHKCFFEYVGHNVMIVAGNRQAQANIFLDRLDDLFHGNNDEGWKISEDVTLKYEDLVSHKSSSLMELTHGVQIRTFPALPTALRGMENIKCVFISEAAHVNRLDDSRVYTALRPITSNDPNVDFILESTPNGKRGFFYDLYTKSDEFHNYDIPFDKALGTVLSEEDVMKLKKDPKIDFEQEYNCKFTSSLSSAFDEEMVKRNYKPGTIKRWENIVGPQLKA